MGGSGRAKFSWKGGFIKEKCSLNGRISSKCSLKGFFSQKFRPIFFTHKAGVFTHICWGRFWGQFLGTFFCFLGAVVWGLGNCYISSRPARAENARVASLWVVSGPRFGHLRFGDKFSELSSNHVPTTNNYPKIWSKKSYFMFIFLHVRFHFLIFLLFFRSTRRGQGIWPKTGS